MREKWDKFRISSLCGGGQLSKYCFFTHLFCSVDKSLQTMGLTLAKQALLFSASHANPFIWRPLLIICTVPRFIIFGPHSRSVKAILSSWPKVHSTKSKFDQALCFHIWNLKIIIFGSSFNLLLNYELSPIHRPRKKKIFLHFFTACWMKHDFLLVWGIFRKSPVRGKLSFSPYACCVHAMNGRERVFPYK